MNLEKGKLYHFTVPGRDLSGSLLWAEPECLHQIAHIPNPTYVIYLEDKRISGAVWSVRVVYGDQAGWVGIWPGDFLKSFTEVLGE